MITKRKEVSGSKLQYQIKKILLTKELQRAVNTLMNWLQSGELSISYYRFILICDMLKLAGVKIDNGDGVLEYIAAYLLLSKSEEIMKVSTNCSSWETNQRVNQLIYTAVQEEFDNLDLLIGQLFADS
jgi:hypothetical protein